MNLGPSIPPIGNSCLPNVPSTRVLRRLCNTVINAVRTLKRHESSLGYIAVRRPPTQRSKCPPTYMANTQAGRHPSVISPKCNNTIHQTNPRGKTKSPYPKTPLIKQKQPSTYPRRTASTPNPTILAAKQAWVAHACIIVPNLTMPVLANILPLTGRNIRQPQCRTPQISACVAPAPCPTRQDITLLAPS